MRPGADNAAVINRAQLCEARDRFVRQYRHWFEAPHREEQLVTEIAQNCFYASILLAAETVSNETMSLASGAFRAIRRHAEAAAVRVAPEEDDESQEDRSQSGHPAAVAP